MNEIQFTAIVGPDGVIRPPLGVVLPTGTVEVIVRPDSQCPNTGDKQVLTHGWLLAMASELEARPVGTVLPQGEIKVSVRQCADDASSADPFERTRSWLLALADEAEAAKPNLPADMAENHDYYAHGKPRQ